MNEIKLKKPLADFTPSEVYNAVKMLEGCRDMIYSRMGSNLCKILNPPSVDTTICGSMSDCYKKGWKDGIEALLNEFPLRSDDFSIKEVLQAIYGGEK